MKNCPKCNRKIIKPAYITVKSQLVGEFKVRVYGYTYCKKCDYGLLKGSDCFKMDNERNKLESLAISKLPIGQFLTTNQTIELLDLTVREFKTDPKIKHGFIIQFKIDNKTYYYKKSVEIYKKTGDGRIKI